MKKIMYRIVSFLIIISMMYSTFSTSVKAETLGDLKQKLEQQQASLEENKKNQQNTQNQINSANVEISKIQETIENTYYEISQLEHEINELKTTIDKKNDEIKKIINYEQVSSGDSSYLEYIFSSNDFTEFIYRLAVSEQLSSYNNDLISGYNEDIIKNKEKQEELAKKREALKQEQKKLEEKVAALGNELSTMSNIQVDIEDEIKYQKELIQLYVDKGCGDNEDIATCGKSYLPSDTAFWRPIASGYVTSNYGYRDSITGIVNSSSHAGIDLSSRPNTNVPVYSIAKGMVAGTMYNSCGGKMLYIYYNINGQTYTGLYGHLKTINVSKGDVVTKDTQIAVMGGGSDTWSWDRCSTGAHLHLQISSGLYGIDYTVWNQLNVRSINPRSLINFPTGTYNNFKDRLTKY